MNIPTKKTCYTLGCTLGGLILSVATLYGAYLSRQQQDTTARQKFTQLERLADKDHDGTLSSTERLLLEARLNEYKGMSDLDAKIVIQHPSGLDLGRIERAIRLYERD